MAHTTKILIEEKKMHLHTTFCSITHTVQRMHILHSLASQIKQLTFPTVVVELHKTTNKTGATTLQQIIDNLLLVCGLQILDRCSQSDATNLCIPHAIASAASLLNFYYVTVSFVLLMLFSNTNMMQVLLLCCPIRRIGSWLSIYHYLHSSFQLI